MGVLPHSTLRLNGPHFVHNDPICAFLLLITSHGIHLTSLHRSSTYMFISRLAAPGFPSKQGEERGVLRGDPF